MNSNATSANSSPRLRFPRRNRSSTKSPPSRNSSTASSVFSALGESSADLFEFVSMNNGVLEKDNGVTIDQAPWPTKTCRNVDKTPTKPRRRTEDPSDHGSACPTIKVSNRGVPGRTASTSSSSEESCNDDTVYQQEIHVRRRVPQKTEKKTYSRPEVQVCSGMTLPLIGTEETLDAVRQGRIQHAACHACQTFLYCIETASMVLCPECRGISPVAPERCKPYLGLGVTLEVALDSLEIDSHGDF